MEIRLYFLIANILITSLFGLISSVPQSILVQELVLHNSDSVFRYQFFYDNYQNKVLEIKYLLQGGKSFPLSKTEWIYSGKNPIIQRTGIYVAGKWTTSHLIESQFTNDLKVNEKISTFQHGVATVLNSEFYQYQEGKLSRILSYAGLPQDGVLLNESLLSD